MKKPFLPKQLLAMTVGGMSFACLLLPQSSLAQSNSRTILQDLDPQQNNNDPLSPRSDEVSNSGFWGLIHRINQGNTNWNPQEQNQQLNDAAAAFKAKQQQLLQQQQTNQPGFRGNTPQPGQ